VTETTKVTISLKPGGVSEKVEISAQVTNVETTNAATGQSLGTETVRELPLATQNYQQLLTAFERRPERVKRGGAAWPRQREALCEWTKGGQQQLSDRRHQRDGLQRSPGNVRSVAESRCDPGVQGADFALRCQPGKKRGWKRKRDSEVWNERAPWGCVRILSQRRFERERILPEQGGQARPSVKQTFLAAASAVRLAGKSGGIFRQLSGNPAAQRAFAGHVHQLEHSSPARGPLTGQPRKCFWASQHRSHSFQYGRHWSLATARHHGTVRAEECVPYCLRPGCRGMHLRCTPGLTNGTVNTGAFALSKPGKFTDDQFTSNWDREFRGGQDKISARFFFSDSESFLPFGGGDLQESLGSTLASSISSTSLNFRSTHRWPHVSSTPRKRISFRRRW